MSKLCIISVNRHVGELSCRYFGCRSIALSADCPVGRMAVSRLTQIQNNVTEYVS